MDSEFDSHYVPHSDSDSDSDVDSKFDSHSERHSDSDSDLNSDVDSDRELSSLMSASHIKIDWRMPYASIEKSIMPHKGLGFCKEVIYTTLIKLVLETV